jgi:sporulation protein YlmC with PRC-barrel domain
MFGQERGWSTLIRMCAISALFILFPLEDSLGAAKSRELKEKPLPATPLRQCRVTGIIDHVVKNDRGEKLGEVDDLVIRRNGKIKKVILSVGDYLGAGYRLVAVSFPSLKIDEKGNILYRVTKEQLEKYPAYTYPKDYPLSDITSRTPCSRRAV